MKTQFTFFAAILLLNISFGQVTNEVLTNESVLTLYGLGIDPSVIVSKIEISTTNFDVSTDAIIDLTKKQLPASIINAMVKSANSTENIAYNANPNDPRSLHKSGIYYYNTLQHDSAKLIYIDPSVYSFSQSSGYVMNALTKGLSKVKDKITIDGEHSRLNILTNKATFYFYFDVNNISLSNSNSFFSSATTPNEFMLIKFREASHDRYVNVGAYNNFGASSGVEEKVRVPFTYDEVANGVYQVTFTQTPESGEYCFLYAGNATGESAKKVFDFTISANILPIEKFEGEPLDTSFIQIGEFKINSSDSIRLRPRLNGSEMYEYIYQPRYGFWNLDQIQCPTVLGGNSYKISQFRRIGSDKLGYKVYAVIETEILNCLVDVSSAILAKEIEIVTSN